MIHPLAILPQRAPSARPSVQRGKRAPASPQQIPPDNPRLMTPAHVPAQQLLAALQSRHMQSPAPVRFGHEGTSSRTPGGPWNTVVVEETSTGQPIAMDLRSKLFQDLGAIYIEGVVSPHMAYDITKELHYLASKRVHENSNDPILMYITSPGGSVQDGNAILDYMKMVQNTPVNGKNLEIIAQVSGYAASYGTILAAAAHKCYMTPRARLMFHEVSGYNGGNSSARRDQQGLSDDLEKELLQVYHQKTGIPLEDLQKWIERRDRWIKAPRAVELGFADGIVTSFGPLETLTPIADQSAMTPEQWAEQGRRRAQILFQPEPTDPST